MNELDETKNTGVFITAPREEDLQVGDVNPTIQNASADWRQYECDGEWQKEMQINFETEACMSFTPVNAIATYLNWLIQTQQIQPAQLAFLQGNGYIGADGKVALSPRFTATMDGTTINGNDFQHPWNSVQNDGLVPDSMWPMPADQMNANPANAWKIYYATPTADVIALGKQFLTMFKVNWHWLVSNGGGASQSEFQIWLKTAPIHVAVAVGSPWNVATPINACGCGAAHGVLLTNVEIGVVNNILDHYAPFSKQLSADYCLAYAVQGWVEQIPQVAPVSPAQTIQEAIPAVHEAIQNLATLAPQVEQQHATLIQQWIDALTALLKTIHISG